MVVLKNGASLYNNLLKIYKKKFDQALESEDKAWKKKYDYNNLNNTDIQQLDQLIPSCVNVSKNVFKNIQNIISIKNDIKNYMNREYRQQQNPKK